jgi:adenylosuccinate synthase
MGADYIDYRNKTAKYYDQLTNKTKEFVSWLQREIGVEIGFIGTGPADCELIDRIGDIENEQEGYREETFRRALMP